VRRFPRFAPFCPLIWRVPMCPRSGIGGESLGARSTAVGFQAVGVQSVEEFADRPLGSEHVKGHMLPVLRNDLVFAFRL
jgi:hypothetical protein